MNSTKQLSAHDPGKSDTQMWEKTVTLPDSGHPVLVQVKLRCENQPDDSFWVEVSYYLMAQRHVPGAGCHTDYQMWGKVGGRRFAPSEFSLGVWVGRQLREALALATMELPNADAKLMREFYSKNQAF